MIPDVTILNALDTSDLEELPSHLMEAGVFFKRVRMLPRSKSNYVEDPAMTLLESEDSLSCLAEITNRSILDQLITLLREITDEYNFDVQDPKDIYKHFYVDPSGSFIIPKEIAYIFDDAITSCYNLLMKIRKYKRTRWTHSRPATTLVPGDFYFDDGVQHPNDIAAVAAAQVQRSGRAEAVPADISGIEPPQASAGTADPGLPAVVNDIADGKKSASPRRIATQAKGKPIKNGQCYETPQAANTKSVEQIPRPPSSKKINRSLFGKEAEAAGDTNTGEVVKKPESRASGAHGLPEGKQSPKIIFQALEAAESKEANLQREVYDVVLDKAKSQRLKKFENTITIPYRKDQDETVRAVKEKVFYDACVDRIERRPTKNALKPLTWRRSSHDDGTSMVPRKAKTPEQFMPLDDVKFKAKDVRKFDKMDRKTMEEEFRRQGRKANVPELDLCGNVKKNKPKSENKRMTEVVRAYGSKKSMAEIKQNEKDAEKRRKRDQDIKRLKFKAQEQTRKEIKERKDRMEKEKYDNMVRGVQEKERKHKLTARRTARQNQSSTTAMKTITPRMVTPPEIKKGSQSLKGKKFCVLPCIRTNKQ